MKATDDCPQVVAGLQETTQRCTNLSVIVDSDGYKSYKCVIKADKDGSMSKIVEIIKQFQHLFPDKYCSANYECPFAPNNSCEQCPYYNKYLL